jgi:hypothetical protein
LEGSAMKLTAMDWQVRYVPTMKMPLFIKYFVMADFALAFIYLFNIWVLGKPFRFLTRMIDLDGESNLPSWYSSVQLFLVAILWSVFTYEKFKREEKRSWVLLFIPALFFMFSFDEIAQIHEWIGWNSDILLPSGSRSETLFSKTGIWMFLMLPPLLVLVFLLALNLRRFLDMPRNISCMLAVGFFIFIGSATGTEILSNLFIGDGMASSLQIALEEPGEMLGVTIMLWATGDLLDTNQIFFLRTKDK